MDGPHELQLPLVPQNCNCYLGRVSKDSGAIMDQERDAISRGRGKWGEAGVPHKGWACVNEYDNFEEVGDDEFITCGMCESSQVRFVHVMENERYPQQLLCGCVCAGHMAEDLVSAEKRDGAMRSRAGKRDRFPDRKGWKTSAKGTPYIKVDGYHLMVVAKRGGGFGVGATPPGVNDVNWGTKRYATAEEAQKGCFDAWQILSNR